MADFNRLVDVFEGQNKDAMDAVLLFVRWFNFIYYDTRKSIDFWRRLSDDDDDDNA